MSDRDHLIVFVDGTTERIYGEASVRDGVLTITAHFGVTSGVKEQKHYPLVNIRSWTATG